MTSLYHHEVLLVLIIAGLGAALNALWEISEWVFDLVEPGGALLDKQHTMVNLSANSLIGVAARLFRLNNAQESKTPRANVAIASEKP